MKLFMDTYAMVEISKGNPNFERYLNDDMVTFKLNLAELYHSLLCDVGEDGADFFTRYFARMVSDMPSDIISEAMKLRKEHNKKRLSYADCLGYIYAKQNKRLFLTGDKEFKGMENVEFVR